MPESSPKRSREDATVRRAQIIAEATSLIGRHGYNGFTVQALAARCGLTNAGLLHYFGSKDKLLLALLEELQAEETEVLAPLVAAAAARPLSRQAIAQLLRTMVARIAARDEMARFAAVLQSEAIDPTHPAHHGFIVRERMALDMFESLVRDVMPDPPATARQLYAMMHGLLQQWLRSGRAFDLVGEWGKAVAMLVPMLAEEAA